MQSTDKEQWFQTVALVLPSGIPQLKLESNISKEKFYIHISLGRHDLDCKLEINRSDLTMSTINIRGNRQCHTLLIAASCPAAAAKLKHYSKYG